MKISTLLLVVLSAGLPVAHAVAPQTGVQSDFTVPHVAGQLIVKLSAGTPATTAATILQPYGAVLLTQNDAAHLAIVGIDSDSNLEAASLLATADPLVEYAEPNYLYALNATPNDLEFPQQWAKDNNGFNAPMGLGTPGADLNLVNAWDTRSSAAEIVIAIIDDSVDTGHLDLADNILPSGKCFASPNSSNPCANGPDDPNPSDADDFHGTLVAGTAGARGNNGIGIAGTAWEVGILPLKVDLSAFAIAAAIDEAIAQDAHIINMSFGGPVESLAMADALDRAEAAGLLAIASAGNADASNDNALHYPSDDPQPNILSIAASNATDAVASFSQWASFSVDLAAPGERTRTTANGNSFAVVSGTSFSAPHAAGVAALVKAHTAAGGYEQVKAHLLYGGIDGVAAFGPVIPGANKEAVPGRTATGRLDAARALAGPPGGVLTIESLAIDDATTGNGNGSLDPGETASLVLTLRNHWLAETAVTGTLSTPDSGLIAVNDIAPMAFGNIAQGASATAAFSVTLASGLTGNDQIFLQLSLDSAGAAVLPERYFYIETGRLENGATTAEAIQRWNWDEFHAYHIDVPAGSRDLFVSTSGSGDIDLLMRYASPPEYLITLDAETRGANGFYYVDRETSISAGSGADESLSVASPLPGTYHVVVVNYDQTAKNYEVSASYTPAGADLVVFSRSAYVAVEGDGTAAITVNRSGGIGSASVDYTTAPLSATANIDYIETSGTLTWGPGESGSRVFEVALINDSSGEPDETIRLTLQNPSGAMLGMPATAELTIRDDDGTESSLAFAETQRSVAENAGSVRLTVVRSNGASGAVSVDYETRGLSAVDGADFEGASGTLSWPDGDDQPRFVDVSILDDSSAESDETLEVVLLNPSGATLSGATAASVVITDNDTLTPAPQPVPSGGGSGGGSLGLIGLAWLAMTRLIANTRRPIA